ncbi:unnamed protein product, partial [Amoebophrya sp. A25]
SSSVRAEVSFLSPEREKYKELQDVDEEERDPGTNSIQTKKSTAVASALVSDEILASMLRSSVSLASAESQVIAEREDLELEVYTESSWRLCSSGAYPEEVEVGILAGGRLGLLSREAGAVTTIAYAQCLQVSKEEILGAGL